MSDELKYEKFFALENLYETKYANLSNGERIGYREDGEGTPLLILHGNFTCSTAMEPLMSKLSPHLRVIAPCMRGFGYSSYNKEMTSLTDLAEDIALFVKEHLKLDKFFVTGHSIGGCVALELAHLMPENILGVLNFS